MHDRDYRRRMEALSFFIAILIDVAVDWCIERLESYLQHQRGCRQYRDNARSGWIDASP